jgi:hypothetical protein
LPVKLSRPLDWIVITDHSDMMGIAFDIQSGAPNVLAVPKGKEWHEGFKKGGKAAGEAAFDLITHFAPARQFPDPQGAWAGPAPWSASSSPGRVLSCLRA